MSEENTIAEESASEEIVEETATEESTNEEVSEESGEESLEASSEGEDYEHGEVEADTQQEFESEVEQAIEDGASEEEIKTMVEEFQLKVNGKTISKTLDWNDKDAVKKELQMAAASQSAMQRAKELEKAYESELKRLQENPWDVLKDVGVDIEDLNERFIEERIKEMEKSPEQIHMEQLEKEISDYREKERKLKEQYEQAEMARLQEQAAVEINKEIDIALSAHPRLHNLSSNPRLRSKVADAMLYAIDELGYEDVSVNDVLPAVENELKLELQEMMDTLPVELMEDFIGKKNLEKLRKKRLEAAKKRVSSPKVKQTTESVSTQKKEKRDKIDAKNFFRNL